MSGIYLCSRAGLIRATTFALGAAAFLMAVAPATAQADCIRRVVSREGYATEGEAKALSDAIGGWNMEVKRVAGSIYADWGKAQQKRQSCALSANKKYWTCTVRAVPCS